MKTALICGISGQDGSWLAELLIKKGYRVIGTSRDAQLTSFKGLIALDIYDQVELLSMSLNDFRSVLQGLKTAQPDEVYNLAGQSSVGLSYEQPVETMESITIATLNLLEGIRFMGREVRFYNASSSECFGDTGGVLANEGTPFRPLSPYAVAKAAAHWEVASYRRAYGLYACSGILFNHESFLRPPRFVTRKIIDAARRIAKGQQEKLLLGDVCVARDWGYAPEYVEAMWRMLQQDEPEDFVIATGEMHTVREFCNAAFSTNGIDLCWEGHGFSTRAFSGDRELVAIDPELYRPSDIRRSAGDATLARARLGWRPCTTFPTLVERLSLEAASPQEQES